MRETAKMQLVGELKNKLAILAFSSCAGVVEELEKEDLKFGFIKLTDMAPLAIAYDSR